MNGESSVQIDRGKWLYRFVLDSGNIAIYRSHRSGQALVSPETWRCLAVLGVTDCFIVPAANGWQPFIEVAEGRQRWALEMRPSIGDAEAAARHFLTSLAESIALAVQLRGNLSDKDADTKGFRPPTPTSAPGEDPTVAEAVDRIAAAREATGWELIYSRQRALR
ncbi:MAG TPA: hypothetical protein VFN61_05575 [Acidimicrobiales bacterium]|nr:hypothetical protein [Acidimicrobiales bacterium]